MCSLDVYHSDVLLFNPRVCIQSRQRSPLCRRAKSSKFKKKTFPTNRHERLIVECVWLCIRSVALCETLEGPWSTHSALEAIESNSQSRRCDHAAAAMASKHIPGQNSSARLRDSRERKSPSHVTRSESVQTSRCIFHAGDFNSENLPTAKGAARLMAGDCCHAPPACIA